MKAFIFVSFILFFINIFSQVKVGENPNTINPSAGLEIEYTNKGFLPPRMTTAQRNAIVNPVEGLQIYNLDFHRIEYFDGTVWQIVSSVQSCSSAPGQPSAITGDINPCAGVSGLVYSVVAVSGISYQWTVPSGWSITSGQGTSSITAISGTTGGSIVVSPSNLCGTGSARTLVVTVQSGIIATGGTITNLPGYRVHTYTSTSSFTISSCSSPGNVEVLIVAGGGGGGKGGGFCGGGGGGGVVYQPAFAISPGTIYSVQVGGGGLGATSDANGANGGNSSFSYLVATGGGGGGRNGSAGVTGGSGGGGGENSPGGPGTAGQGFGGGNGVGGSSNGGGGGGGAAGTGGTGATPVGGGAGGPGVSNSISGTAVHYSGGGGGGAHFNPGGIGGTGGGGKGGKLDNAGSGNIPAVNGASNTGGGGGGGCVTVNGANGGSGIVIIRYPITNP